MTSTRRLTGRVILALCLLSCLGWPPLSEAQLSVFDASNLIQNTATVTHLLTIIRMYVSDLAALQNLPAVLALIQHVTDLAGAFEALAAEAGVLSDGWGQLATQGQGLCAVATMRAWKAQAVQWSQRGNSYARQAQGLTQRAGTMITILIQLLSSIEVLTGTTSGLQSTSALLGVAAIETQKLSMILSGQQSVMVGKELIEDVVSLGTECLQRAMLADWGTYTPPWQ